MSTKRVILGEGIEANFIARQKLKIAQLTSTFHSCTKLLSLILWLFEVASAPGSAAFPAAAPSDRVDSSGIKSNIRVMPMMLV